MNVTFPRLLFGFVLGAVAAAVLFLAADFGLSLFATIEIRNASGMSLRHVEISWSDTPAWSGSIRDGESRQVTGMPPAEGAFRVDIELADGRRRTETFGYASPFLGQRYFITVRQPPGGSLDVDITYCDAGLLVEYCT